MAECLLESPRSKYISVVVNFNNLRFMTLVDENHHVADLIKEVQNNLAKLCSVKIKIKTLKNNVNAVLPEWYPVAPLLKNQDEIFAFTDSAAEILNGNLKKHDDLSAATTPALLNATSPEGYYATIPDSGFTSPVAKPGSSEPSGEHMRSSGVTVGRLERGNKGNKDNESQDEGNELMSEIFSLKDQCLNRVSVKGIRVETAEKSDDLNKEKDVHNLVEGKQGKPEAEKTSANAKIMKSVLHDTNEIKRDNNGGQSRLAKDEMKSKDNVQEKEIEASVKEGSSDSSRDSSSDESSWMSYESATKAKDLQTLNKKENLPLNSQNNESTTKLQKKDALLKTRGKSSQAHEGVQATSEDSTDGEQCDKQTSKDGNRDTAESLFEKKTGSTEASEIVSRNDKKSSSKKEDSSESCIMAVNENVGVNKEGETLPCNETRLTVDSMNFNDEEADLKTGKADSIKHPEDKKSNFSGDESSSNTTSKKRKTNESTTIQDGKRSNKEYTNQPKSKQRSLLGEKSINSDIQEGKTKSKAKVEVETSERVTRDRQKKNDKKNRKTVSSKTSYRKKDYFEDGGTSDSSSSDSDMDLDTELVKISKKRGVFTEKQQTVASNVSSNCIENKKSSKKTKLLTKGTNKKAENVGEKSPENKKAFKGEVEGAKDDLFSDSDSSWCSYGEDKKSTEAQGNEKDDEMNLKHHETRAQLLNNDIRHTDGGTSKSKGAANKVKTLAKSGSKSDFERVVERNNASQLENRDEVTSLDQMPVPENINNGSSAKSLSQSKKNISLDNIELEKNDRAKATEVQSDNDFDSSRSTISTLKDTFTQVPVKDKTNLVEPIDPTNFLSLAHTPSTSASRKSAASLSAKKVASWLLTNPVEDEIETASQVSLKATTHPEKNKADTIVYRIENNYTAVKESQLKKSKVRSKKSQENVKNIDTTGGRFDDDDSTARSQSQISKKSTTRSKKRKGKITNVGTTENSNENEAELGRSDVKKSKSRSNKSEGNERNVDTVENNIDEDESPELSQSQISKKSKTRSKKSKGKITNVGTTENSNENEAELSQSDVKKSKSRSNKSEGNVRNVDTVENNIDDDESPKLSQSQISKKSKTRSKKSKEKMTNVDTIGDNIENEIEKEQSLKVIQTQKRKLDETMQHEQFDISGSLSQISKFQSNMNRENVETVEDKVGNDDTDEPNQSQISKKSKVRSKKSKEKSSNLSTNESNINNNESTTQTQEKPKKEKPRSKSRKENIDNVDTTEDEIENNNSIAVNESQKRKLDATTEQEDKSNKTNKNKKKKADIREHEQPLDEENREDNAFTTRPTATKKEKNTSLSLPKVSKGLSALLDDESEYKAEISRKTKQLKLTRPAINRHLNKSGFLTPSNDVERKKTGSTSTKSRVKSISSSQPSRTIEMNEKEKEFLDSGALNLETLFNDETISW